MLSSCPLRYSTDGRRMSATSSVMSSMILFWSSVRPSLLGVRMRFAFGFSPLSRTMLLRAYMSVGKLSSSASIFVLFPLGW